jgi:UPF0271 protein
VIELSADLGEGSPGEDELWPLLDAANVACGGHAGDEESMTRAVRLAVEHDVHLGAHPSYPDREHFGRRSLVMAAHELRESLAGQIEALHQIALREGVALEFVKPHGALYNDAHRNRGRADIIIQAMRDVDARLAIVAPDHSQMAAAARGAQVVVIREAFADRRYMPDGSLVPRTESNALLSIEEAAAQAELLARERVVIAADGTRVTIRFDTVCVHADMEGAIARVRAIRERLAALG